MYCDSSKTQKQVRMNACIKPNWRLETDWKQTSHMDSILPPPGGSSRITEILTCMTVVITTTIILNVYMVQIVSTQLRESIKVSARLRLGQPSSLLPAFHILIPSHFASTVNRIKID